MRNLILALFLTLLSPQNAVAEPGNPINLNIRQIDSLLTAKPDQRIFGKLEFLGGLEISSKDGGFGGFSGFRFLDNSKFLSITDKGKWLKGELIRDGQNLVTIKSPRMGRLRDSADKKLIEKSISDAEGLELLGKDYLITFERNHRVENFAFNTQEKLTATTKSPLFTLTDLGLKRNSGLEGIALAPDTSPLRGSLLIFPEHAFNDDGNLRVFTFKDGGRNEFALKPNLGFSLTDAAFHPNGDLYILERKYSLFTGLAVRIRRLEANSLKLGETFQGEELINIDGSHEVDNMEGISVSALKDGSTRITIISDDNFSKNQRTLLLEFSLRQ